MRRQDDETWGGVLGEEAVGKPYQEVVVTVARHCDGSCAVQIQDEYIEQVDHGRHDANRQDAEGRRGPQRGGEDCQERNTAVRRKGKYGDGDEAATLGGRRVVQEIGQPRWLSTEVPTNPTYPRRYPRTKRTQALYLLSAPSRYFLLSLPLSQLQGTRPCGQHGSAGAIILT